MLLVDTATAVTQRLRSTNLAQRRLRHSAKTVAAANSTPNSTAIPAIALRPRTSAITTLAAAQHATTGTAVAMTTTISSVTGAATIASTGATATGTGHASALDRTSGLTVGTSPSLIRFRLSGTTRKSMLTGSMATATF